MAAGVQKAEGRELGGGKVALEQEEGRIGAGERLGEGVGREQQDEDEKADEVGGKLHSSTVRVESAHVSVKGPRFGDLVVIALDDVAVG